MKKKLVIFDLDGTLVNSIYAISNATNKALKYHNLKTYDVKQMYNFVGLGLKKVVEKIVKLENYNIDIDLILSKLLEIYELEYGYNLKTYKGIKKLLKYLEKNNIKYAIITNKDQNLAQKSTKIEDLIEFNFDEIIGLDILKRENAKPSPINVEKLIKKHNLKNEEVLFVGDMLVDLKAAQNANVDFVYCNWGFGKQINEKIDKKYIINTVEEIIERL